MRLMVRTTKFHQFGSSLLMSSHLVPCLQRVSGPRPWPLLLLSDGSGNWSSSAKLLKPSSFAGMIYFFLKISEKIAPQVLRYWSTWAATTNDILIIMHGDVEGILQYGTVGPAICLLLVFWSVCWYLMMLMLRIPWMNGISMGTVPGGTTGAVPSHAGTLNRSSHWTNYDD